MVSIWRRAAFRQTAAAVAALIFSGAAAAQGIYTCTDSNGRRITADRPIAECTDRTQRELSNTGTVKREIGPSLTARERAAQEEKEKAAREVAERETENKRRDRALLLRYPSRNVHEQERATALAQIEEVIKAASKRTSELAEQRATINLEMEFYAKDPSKAPFAPQAPHRGKRKKRGGAENFYWRAGPGKETRQSAF